jgi:hypothetical protein
VADRDEMIEDYRQFTREMLTRFDRSLREFRAEGRARHAEVMARIERLGRDSDAHHERESRRIDDQIAEAQAQRRALFAIVDRLEGNGGAAAAT